MIIFDLPTVLEPAREKLQTALDVTVEAEWPDELKYQVAEQAQAIAAALIPAFHQHLVNLKVCYLFREKISEKLGVAMRASGKLAHFTGFDFVIEFNWSAWLQLSSTQRIALVDHELCHCVLDDDGYPAMRKHDVEEFGDIVKRYGLWRPDLAAFSKTFPKEG